MNTKKMTASLVGVMLIATVFVMAASAVDDFGRDDYLTMPRMVYEFDADNDTGIYVNWNDTLSMPTVRIYGEADAIYPTQSYNGTFDFIYPDPVDPFDPGVIAMDSATFNPAYMYNAASVDGGSLEDDMKVFFRVFYEPEYGHVEDGLMLTNYSYNLEPVSMPEGALVTETTYMLVEYDDAGPLTGAAGSTSFNMSVNAFSSMDGTPGMDVGGMVDLVYAEGDGPLGVDKPTDGTIEVAVTYHNVAVAGPKLRFMDHEVNLIDIECGNPPKAEFEVEYIGNMAYLTSESKSIIVAGDGAKYYLTRYNDVSGTTDEGYRWFISVTDVSCAGTCDITLGRRLVAGETFYVDGIRYDMPAIYVTDDDMFKYITLQSPLPKCTTDCVMWAATTWTTDGLVGAQTDESHVGCQCLAKLCINQSVWVLPPFNQDGHRMIDDIGLPECTGGGASYGTVDALEFYYIKEDTEERFDSSLAERHAYNDSGFEIWNWWSIFTKPYHYVELVLPNDEEADCSQDGYEYLITTSFIAPNCKGPERDILCSKLNEKVHDIIDRAATIAVTNDTRRDAYADMPRVAFEYNAIDTEDLFVNDGSAPTVRIYGEEGAIYPTQSMTGAADFIYPDAVDPFDPGIIPKDSVTFNPAYIDGMYLGYYEDDDPAITVDGNDGDEKVFFRAFYEPGYGHAADDVMGGCYNDLDTVTMSDGALVTETTYMLLRNNRGSGHSGNPKLGGVAAGTHFMLPIRADSLDDNSEGEFGMDVGGMVDLAYAEAGPTVTAGTIEVEKQYLEVEGYCYEYRDFMDHRVYVVYIDDNYAGVEHVTFDVEYIGNVEAEYDKMKRVTMTEGQKLYFNRNNLWQSDSDSCHRWYLEVVEIFYSEFYGETYVDIKLGRTLVAGETFYVDGVRYDMPAIYVAEDVVNDPGVDKFKYITFQSPMPKCYGESWEYVLTENQYDESHVTSQWLANLIEYEPVPVLPPFNDWHTMIDDIDLAKFNAGGMTEICNEAGNIIECPRDSLEFYYIAEDIEERFNSSLAERHAYNDSGFEIWNWWSIFTKPYQYTELMLPNQETTSDSYEDSTCLPVDGNEYLITTSFIAPNSEGPERDLLSKTNDEVHDIIDRAATLLGGPAPGLCGDVTGDGSVNMGDVIMLFDHVTNGVPPVDASVADVTGDGSVNMGDVIMLFDHVTDGVPPLNCP